MQIPEEEGEAGMDLGVSAPVVGKRLPYKL